VSEEHGQVIDEELSAENEARRRLALAQIRQWPDPVLKLRAEGVEAFHDDLVVGDGLPRPEGEPFAHYAAGVDVEVFPPRIRFLTDGGRRA